MGLRLREIPKSWYFLFFVLIAYAVLFFVDFSLFVLVFNFFLDILVKILPVFILVFILMGLTNYLISPRFLMRHLGGRGFKKWFFVVIGGILSTGPIYMWYPLLADLRKKGLRFGLIACFLYNRAIKIPLLPVAFLYFGWRYVLVLSFVMIFASVFQGILLDRIINGKGGVK